MTSSKEVLRSVKQKLENVTLLSSDKSFKNSA